MLVYRKDLFDAKGLQMPELATYDDIKKFADALTDKTKAIYGITLRGKPAWGENIADGDMIESRGFCRSIRRSRLSAWPAMR
jgi:sorbitol/mannitol transport system substrate-binding protein